MKQTQEILLKLVRLGLENEFQQDLPTSVKWGDLMDLAEKQGVMAIAFDGLQKVPREQMPPIDCLMDWLGQVSFMESKYDEYRDSLIEQSKLLKENDIEVLVMKGYGLSLNFLQPKHRPLGDLDIFPLNGGYEKVNTLIEAKGIEVDRSHYKHSIFSFKNLTVENHHGFLNAHAHRSTAEIEEILEAMVSNADYKTSEFGNVYYPSANFNALYLLRHSGEHFVSVDMSVRVVLDLATFVSSLDDKERSECWKWLLKTLDKVGMKEYLAVLNAICVRHLGYSPSLFPILPVDERLVERSMTDILQPEFAQVAGSSRKEKRSLPSELHYRFRRWKANGCKHDIVYRERMWQSLITQLWSHVLKPSLIDRKEYGWKQWILRKEKLHCQAANRKVLS